MITRMQADLHDGRSRSGSGGLRLLTGLIGLAVIANSVVAVGYLSAGAMPHSRAPAPTVAVAPAPDPDLRPAAINALLQRRAAAVRSRDRSAFLGTVDPSAAGFAADQRRLFDNLARLPLAAFTYTAAGMRSTGGGWWVEVTLRYRLRDFDDADVVRRQYVHVVHRPGTGWVVAGTGAAHGLPDDPEVWDSGRLTVVRGRRSLVLGADADHAQLRQIADRIDAGIPVVSGVVGRRWARRAVVLVPASQEQAARLVGRTQDLGKIAALATVTGAPDHPADRIVVAPHTFPRLNSLGRRVVLTHELTHLATGGARDTRTPMWLIEGLADYVGYKGIDVSPAQAAGELAAEVRGGRLPTGLPGQQDFAGSSPRLSQAYQEAWLACRLIVERYGERRLWRLYRAAGGQAGPADEGAGAGEDGAAGAAADPGEWEARAIRGVLGIEISEFVRMWRDYLRTELGG